MDIMTNPALPTSAEAPDAPVTRGLSNRTERLLFRLNERAVLRLTDFGYTIYAEDPEKGRYRAASAAVGFMPGQVNTKAEVLSLMDRDGIEPTEEARAMLEALPARFDYAHSAVAAATRPYEPRPRPSWLHESNITRRKGA